MRAFKFLSTALNSVMSELNNNQNFKKLIRYNNTEPLSSPDVLDTIIEKELKPYPFSQDNVQQISNVVVRAYISDAEIDESGVITDYTIMFDILVPVSMWIIKILDEDGKKRNYTRAFSIMEEISATFEDKSIGTLGVMSIDSIIILQVNDNVAGYRVQASAFGINERPTDD